MGPRVCLSVRRSRLRSREMSVMTLRVEERSIGENTVSLFDFVSRPPWVRSTSLLLRPGGTWIERRVGGGRVVGCCWGVVRRTE